MAETSGIEWTDATWNPWRGCTKVSPGCARCYMFREQDRYGRDPAVVVRSKTTFESPLRWKEPRVIFTCSWSDFFHKDADDWRPAAWDIIERTPQHTYLVLTKRPERMPGHMAERILPNVVLGVSVENQRWVDRIPLLLEIPAFRYFVSAEPLLGPVRLEQFLGDDKVSWVIAGGESGPGYREMDLAWAASLRDQCASAGVAFFLKQLGGWPDKRGGEQALLDGIRWVDVPF